MTIISITMNGIATEYCGQLLHRALNIPQKAVVNKVDMLLFKLAKLSLTTC